MIVDELWLESAYAAVSHDRVFELLRAGTPVFAQYMHGGRGVWCRVVADRGRLVWADGLLVGAEVAAWPLRRWRLQP